MKKNRKGKKNVEWETATKARRPCTDREMLILLYIWFVHTNIIKLGYIILLTSDLYNYQASQLFEQKMIFISMENPRQLILIASSSKEKPLHSLSEFCQQSLHNVTRAGSWTQEHSWYDVFFPCLDQSP